MTNKGKLQEILNNINNWYDNVYAPRFTTVDHAMRSSVDISFVNSAMDSLLAIQTDELEEDYEDLINQLYEFIILNKNNLEYITNEFFNFRHPAMFDFLGLESWTGTLEAIEEVLKYYYGR